MNMCEVAQADQHIQCLITSSFIPIFGGDVFIFVGNGVVNLIQPGGGCLVDFDFGNMPVPAPFSTEMPAICPCLQLFQ